MFLFCHSREPMSPEGGGEGSPTTPPFLRGGLFFCHKELFPPFGWWGRSPRGPPAPNGVAE